MSSARRQDNKFIVYTDIIGHTRMFGRIGTAFRPMRERHDAIFTDAVKALAPSAVVKGTGDGFYAAFDDVSAALEVALAFKYGLATEDWMKFLPPEKKTPDNAIKCRIGVHTGLVNLAYAGEKAVDFDGQPRVIAEKVMSSAAANQVLISRPVRDQAMVNFSRREEVRIAKFGEYKFRDVADTVEVWAIADDEAGLGPKPVQPPEHRVILFAVIDNHAALGESGGVGFTESKDAWDRLFDQTLAEHSQDAFVKRLPEGTLAAFRTAIEALRVARDFRRALKAHLPQMSVALAPRIGMDSGLVTFEYADNRPADVRDQPVNVAAKVAKVDKPVLCNPWQTILSRPVREDAYANLKERDDYKWVCLGRKSVPGEPEPIELWDFQDAQTKSDSRTVLWIDASKVKASASGGGEASPAWKGFVKRLGQMLEEVLAQREGEKPWIIPTAEGFAAAFSNPVEAVAAADDLRKAALLEPWEKFATGYRRAGREDNLLRLGLALGPLRVMYEDGQIKDLKGEAVDGVRAIAAQGKQGQVLVSREVMDAAATAFPENEVKWRSVEGGSKDGTEAFEFVRLAKKSGSTRGILIGSGIAAAAVTAAIVGVVFFGGPRAVQRTAGDVTPMVAGLETLAPDDTARGLIAKLKQLYGERDLELQRQEMPIAERTSQIQEELKPYESLLQAWATRFDPRAIEAARPALDAVTNLEGLKGWLDGLSQYEQIAASNPINAGRGRWLQQITSLRGDLETAGLAGGPLGERLTALGKRIEDARAKPWVAANKESIESEAKAIDAELAEGGTLTKDVRDAFEKWAQANQGQAAAEAKRRAAAAQQASGLPVEVLEPIFTAASGPAQLVRQAGAKADQLAQALTGTPADKERAIKPVAEALARLTKDFRQYDFSAASGEVAPAIEAAATPDALVAALGKLDNFRRLDSDPRKDEEWGRTLDGLKQTLQRERARNDETDAAIAGAERTIAELREVPMTVANQQRLKDGAAAVDALLAEGGPVRSAVASAVAKAREQQQQGLAAAQRDAEIQGEVDRLLAQASVPGADEAGLRELWKTVRDGVKAAGGSAAESRDRLTAWQAALAGASKAVPAPAAVPAGAPRWRADLASAGARAREDAIAAAAKQAKPEDPASLAPLMASAGEAVKTEFAALDALASRVEAVESALNRALKPDESIGGEPPLAQLAEGLRKDPLLARPGVQQAVAPVLDRLTRLEQVGAMDQFAELADAARNAPGSAPELVVAAWRRLGSVGGAEQPAWLTAQSDVSAKIAALGAPLPAERVEAIKREIAADKPARWAKHFESIGELTAIRAARGAEQAFGVTDAVIAGLSPTAKYNHSLILLREAVARGAGDDELRAQAAKVIAAAGAAGGAAAAGAKDLQAALDGNLAQVAAASGELPLAEAGPGKAGWEVANQGGDSVTYRMRLPEGKTRFYPEQPAPEITFVRVGSAAGGGGGSVYLATTALSVGQGLAILDAFGDWSTAQSFASRQANNMATPGSWRIGTQRFALGLRQVKNAPSWMTNTGNEQNAEQYVAGVNAGVPTLGHPMQYVSPRLGLYLARLVGSRLPSAAEWSAALDADGGVGDLSMFNLRDQALMPILQRSASGALPTGYSRPDVAAFINRGTVTEAYPHNDNAVFFMPVDEALPAAAGRRFRHLIGNVAQLLLEDPDRVNDLEPGGVGDFVRQNGGAFAVVGGSALWPVRDAAGLRKPEPISAATLNTNNNRGWSDVGIRLAFSTARPAQEVSERSLADRVNAVANAMAFVTPKAGG